MGTKVLIIEGPNSITTENEIKGSCDFNFEFYHSNCEGKIIDKIHEVGYDTDNYNCIVFHPCSSRNSIAIADAIRAIEIPVIMINPEYDEIHDALLHAVQTYIMSPKEKIYKIIKIFIK